MEGTITVVVPARNSGETIGLTLAALAAQEVDTAFEVIVVDSGSSDDTVAIAEASPIVDAVLHNPGGEPAGSRNVGVAYGRGPILAFTDSDCEPTPGWLAAGVRALQEAEIVQGRVLPAGHPGPFDRTLWVQSEYGLYETANLFVARETFERLGGFEAVVALDSGELVPGVAGATGLGSGGDTRPFGEDTWFAWRAKRAGARTAFAPEAIVHHAVFPRRPRAFVAERARCRYFPPLVALIPELREHFLHRRWWLSPRSLRFDLALLGLTLAVLTRRPLPAVLVTPYLRALATATAELPPRARGEACLIELAADLVTGAALARGSLHTRTPVL